MTAPAEDWVDRRVAWDRAQLRAELRAWILNRIAWWGDLAHTRPIALVLTADRRRTEAAREETLAAFAMGARWPS